MPARSDDGTTDALALVRHRCLAAQLLTMATDQAGHILQGRMRQRQRRTVEKHVRPLVGTGVVRDHPSYQGFLHLPEPPHRLRSRCDQLRHPACWKRFCGRVMARTGQPADLFQSDLSESGQDLVVEVLVVFGLGARREPVDRPPLGTRSARLMRAALRSMNAPRRVSVSISSASVASFLVRYL